MCRVLFLLVSWIMWMMPAWMVSALDEIRVVSNSVIQSFTEYHDSSCARLNALQNSPVGRGHQVWGESKLLVQGQAVCWEKTFFFPAAVKKSAWRDVGRSS